jgi:hypothetical protein
MVIAVDGCDILCGMDESDKQHVGEALRRIWAVHRAKYGTDVFNGMWAGLQGMSRADFDRALVHVERYSKWPPTPATFWAALKQGWL